jgi:sporulation protein YlmC with PRC-barrel domain
MQKTIVAIALFFSVAMTSHHVFAQSTATVDPACLMKDADGTEKVDTTKCPDGMSIGTAAATSETTASTAAASNMIVPSESLNGAKIMSASDFIGKRVFSSTGDDIGEVNDIIVSDNGSVQAVILGVGGFLGMGEKDVAVAMSSINMTQDGSATKLIVEATKDQLTAAPTYDRSTKTYVN